jgi:aspartate/methionine/tyrosine aminotransferase
MPPSSKTIEHIMEAPIQRIKALQGKDQEIISFDQGVPWFGPPAEALKAAMERIAKSEADRYGMDEGNWNLRVMLASFLKDMGILGTRPDDVIVTPGANQAAFIALACVADKYDEVILFRPYYFNHLMALQILGITPVIVDTDESYHIDPGLVEKSLTARTRAMIINSPANPTGAMIDLSALEGLAALARKHGIIIISDEPYLHFAWDRPHISPLSLDEELTIGLFSFSKSYGMSGWRLGWMKVPRPLVTHCIKAADTLHICAPVASQILGEEIMKGHRDSVQKFQPDMKKARDILAAELQPLAFRGLIGAPRSEGGFYIFLRLEGPRCSGWDVASQLVKTRGVATVPGEPFGMEGAPYIRISYGNLPSFQAKIAAPLLRSALESVLTT